MYPGCMQPEPSGEGNGYVVDVHLVPGFIVRWNEGPTTGAEGAVQIASTKGSFCRQFNPFLNRAESRLGRRGIIYPTISSSFTILMNYLL